MLWPKRTQQVRKRQELKVRQMHKCTNAQIAGAPQSSSCCGAQLCVIAYVPSLAAALPSSSGVVAVPAPVLACSLSWVLACVPERGVKNEDIFFCFILVLSMLPA